MQNDRDVTSSINHKKLLVMRSLRRSNIRKKIAEYLFEISPVASYISEIAENIKTAPTNVIGAIRGMDSRYKKEESLMALKLVEKVKSGNDIKLYKITKYGKEIISNLRK